MSIFAALSGGMAGSVGGGLVGAIAGGGQQRHGVEAAQSSGGSTAETIAMDVLKSGFGMVPLVTTLFGLFGGGDPSAGAAGEVCDAGAGELPGGGDGDGFRGRGLRPERNAARPYDAGRDAGRARRRSM